MEFRKSSYSTHATSSCAEAGASAWAAPSYSFANGNCVQAAGSEFTGATASLPQAHCAEAGGAQFTKAQDSNFNGSCAEAGDHGGVIFLRDSKDPRCATGDFGHLHYTREEWDGGRAVTFTPVAQDVVPAATRKVALNRGHYPAVQWYAVTRRAEPGTVLHFDQGEKDAWEAGVASGEFIPAEPALA